MSMSDADEVRCPFCNAASAELLSLFGSQLLLSQYRCASCGSYFEGLRPDRRETEADVAHIQGAHVCDHPEESVDPATGAHHDGR
jgi:DNA-directed RNA polymerase subunit RPC12/RpoP